MSRVGKILLVLTMLLPGMAVAQRPSGNVWINSAELYLGRGLRSNRPDEQQKLFEQALAAATDATTKQPGNPRSWFVLGRVQAAMRNIAAADSSWDRAEQMWPEYAKEIEEDRFRVFAIASNMGIAAIQANNLPGAVKALEAASQIYNKRPAAVLNLATVYARLNEHEKSIGAYRAALEILRGPKPEDLKPEEAKQWAEWEEATALNLAQALAFADRNEEAAQAYEAYLAIHPENVLIRSNLAVVYSRMGKKEEAARVYRELLGRDLAAEEYYRVGIGLRRAQQLDQAVAAFTKSLAKNPQQQEAYYNLAYSLWESIQPLEDARAKAKAADAANMANQLRPMYEQLIAAGNKARELDPTNRNMFALLQRGYRGLADLAKDPKVANEIKLKIPPLITAYDALPFEVVAIVPDVKENKVTIEGQIVNLKMTKGQPMKIRLAVVDAAGTELDFEEITVTAPDVEAEADFKAEFDAKGYAGWKYAIVK